MSFIMKKAVLFLILMGFASCAFATTPKLARGCNFGEVVAGTVVGLFAADALKSVFTPRPAPVYYAAPVPVYPVYPASYVFNPYTQSYEPCYY